MMHPISRCEFFHLRGRTFHVRHWGDEHAPPLFLLHGWMDASITFQFMAQTLAQRWHLIAPDWRGFGHSEWNGADSYYFPDYLADLDALLDALSPDQPATLIGHSMGGIVASLYAGVRPERVDRLVSIEGFGLKNMSPQNAPARYTQWLDERRNPPRFERIADIPQLAQRLMRRNPHLIEARAMFLAAHLSVEQPEGGRRYLADPRHKMVNPVLYRLEEAKACWRQIQAPVQWIIGGMESEHPLAQSVFATLGERRACIKNLQEVHLKECGHMVQWEQPEACAHAIETFLNTPTENA